MKRYILLLLTTLLISTNAKAIYFDDDAVLQQGYRGFADFSYTLGTGDFNFDRVSMSTSHGYQIAPQFFAGIGVGVNYYYDDESFGMPIFAHFRSDILTTDITPYVDLKVGYSVFDVEGMYLNPSIGCRFSLSDRIGLNVGIGYTMQKADVYYFGKQNIGGVDFRFGIDF